MKDDDFKLLRGFADRRTDGQTFVIVESLSRLKIFEPFQLEKYLVFFCKESLDYFFVKNEWIT